MTRPTSTLVLRRVPAARRHLARALAPDADDAGGTWWELVDIAAAPASSPTGVALTRTDGTGVARVLALAALSTPDGDRLPQLVLELVTALRGTDLAAVEIRCRRADVLAVLDGEGADRVEDRIVLRF